MMELGKGTQMAWLKRGSVTFGKEASWLLQWISWGKSIPSGLA